MMVQLQMELVQLARTRLCTEYAYRFVGPPGMQIPSANALCQGDIRTDGTCRSAQRHIRKELE